MTFADLYGAQLNIELASSDTTQLFTTARRKKAINDAQLAFVRQTNCTKRYGQITMVDGTGEYNVVTTLTDFLRLLAPPSIKVVTSTRTYYIQGKDDFPRRDPEWLDWQEPNWRAADAGTPASWYQRREGGIDYLGVTPPPDITAPDAWTLLVPYLGRPADMSADSDQPFKIGTNVLARLEPYHQGLVHFAAALLEPLRKGYAAAERQMNLYAGYTADFITQARAEGPDQITIERTYYGESRSGRALDPRRWP
jgi:hypothetical protein